MSASWKIVKNPSHDTEKCKLYSLALYSFSQLCSYPPIYLIRSYVPLISVGSNGRPERDRTGPHSQGKERDSPCSLSQGGQSLQSPVWDSASETCKEKSNNNNKCLCVVSSSWFFKLPAPQTSYDPPALGHFLWSKQAFYSLRSYNMYCFTTNPKAVEPEEQAVKPLKQDSEPQLW